MVRPGRIHVLASAVGLTLDAGRLRLRPSGTGQSRNPIDVFFASLAKDMAERSIGIVLSGSGSDGTLGLKAIKEAGGLTIAQGVDGTAPRYPSMPDTAIAAHIVDLVIPVNHMAERLASLGRTPVFDTAGPDEAESGEAGQGGVALGGVALGGVAPGGVAPGGVAPGGVEPGGVALGGVAPGGVEPGGVEPGDAVLAAEGADLTQERPAICAILRNQVGHDFTSYKDRTFFRRVHRRMQVLQLETADGYMARLRQDPEEVARLFRDLLIGVTSFFRDADAFESLAATVVPKLFENRGADGQIRVWVPGCSTGEEAYSLAILLREHMVGLRGAPRVQIFATDIDEQALAVARLARYPAAMLADKVSPERLARHFTRDGDSQVMLREVRDLCVFSAHSVIRDPPFSRMDLVSCRNLLIYLDLPMQQRVMPIFHYALRPGGHLFLGASESVGKFGELFNPLDKKQRIFVRRDQGNAVTLPLWLPGQGIRSLGRDGGRGIAGGPSLRAMAEARVLERFAPAHVVVDRDGDVIHYSAHTGRYLEAASGAPGRNLLMMARRGLRLELRMVLHEALETLRPAQRNGLVVELDDGLQVVGLRVDPLPGAPPGDEGGQGAEPLFLVVFTDQGAAGPDAAQRPPGAGQPSDEATVVRLDRELRDTRDRLQSTIEEYETGLEELKAANEELVSVNEELQSTNEELETAKEEAQSVNEELQTVNHEMHTKLDLLDRAYGDLRNLFDSTEIATVFLDPQLVVRSFTPAATGVFKLIPGDHGQPLTDIASELNVPMLQHDIAAVLEGGRPMERQVARRDGTMHYLMRLSPYRTAAGTVDGVVVAFVDVSGIVAAEAHQRTLVAELNHRVKNTLGVVVGIATATLAARPPRQTFVARLRALSRLHELLSRDTWVAVPLRDVLMPEIEIYREAGRERVSLTGPDLKVSPRLALSLGLVMHELMTNAVKYGALDAKAGKVLVDWSILTDPERPRLRLVWRERGGPMVQPPTHRGFGSRIIEREITHGLGGSIGLDFAPTGLVVTIEVPIGHPEGGVVKVERRPGEPGVRPDLP